jgi:hypothetical protein
MRPLRTLSAVLLCSAASLSAQSAPTLTGRVGVISNSMTRGVSWSDVPQVLAGATLVAPSHGWTTSATLSASGETGTPGGVRTLNPTRRAVTFTGYYADLNSAHDTKAALFTAGANGSLYPVHSGNSDWTTSEIYGVAAFHAPLAPTLSVFRDIAAMRGTYAELGVSHPVSVAGSAITLGQTTGYSISQGKTASTVGNFATNGVPFVSVSAATTVRVGRVDLAPTLVVQRNIDQWAQARGPSFDYSTGRGTYRVWFTMNAAMSRVLGRRADVAKAPAAAPERVGASDAEAVAKKSQQQ